MRSLKRPLSILIAALMLVSVMVIAPVTASATTVEIEIKKWVEGQTDVGNEGCFRFDDLYSNFKFVRVTQNQAPSWGSTVINECYSDLRLESGKDTYKLTGWNDGKMTGYWDDYGVFTEGIHIDARAESMDYTAVDWYAWTWETFELTEYAAGTLTDNGKKNIECYKNGDRYFLHRNDTYEEVNKSEVFFDYVSPTGEGVNYNGTLERNNDDPMLSVAGFPAEVKSLDTLGVQLRSDLSGTFRFVTLIDSTLLNNADDYGYIVAKTDYEANVVQSKLDQLTVGHANVQQYSCKGTTNTFAGKYGDGSVSDYKYVSCAVTDIDETVTVLGRFYITMDGTNYVYATCGSYDGMAYRFTV